MAKDSINFTPEWFNHARGQLGEDKLFQAAYDAVDECFVRSYTSQSFEPVEAALSQAQHKYDVYPSETGYDPNNHPEVSQILATHSPTVSISQVEACQLTLSHLIWAHAPDYPQWLPELLSLVLIRPDFVDDQANRLKLDDPVYQDAHPISTKLKIVKLTPDLDQANRLKLDDPVYQDTRPISTKSKTTKLTPDPDDEFKIEFTIQPLDSADCAKLEIRMISLVSTLYWAYSKHKAGKDKDPQGANQEL